LALGVDPGEQGSPAAGGASRKPANRA
jgi:hypothetical protein